MEVVGVKERTVYFPMLWDWGVVVMSKPRINFAIKLLDPELLDLKP